LLLPESITVSTPNRPQAYYRNGLLCGIAAFTSWGLFPIYWRWLAHVPSVEVVCHRIVWSFVFLTAVFWLNQRQLTSDDVANARPKIGRQKLIAIYSLAAMLISVNWFVFIWAVGNGRVIEASLGYFINPLLSILLGVMFLREKLSRLQGIAIGIAAIGVVVMAYAGGVMPWLSLSLAASFALYGMVKKAAPLPAMTGLLIETTVLVLPAAGYLVWLESKRTGSMGQGDLTTIGLLLLGGCVTVFPLALFATAAQRVSLSTLGVLQYFGPTLQFILGVVVYDEPMNIGKLIGFVFVWIGSIAFLAALRMQSLRTYPGTGGNPA
jgi:chloramphenicol-sensitive protein RarD